jgi:hypothetical protein
MNEQVPPTPPAVTSAPRTCGLATASLVLGILGLVCLLPIISPILALIFGIIALGQISRSCGSIKGQGRAIAGLVLGGVGLLVIIPAFLAALLLPALNQARFKARQAACVNNVKQIGLGCAMYADEHNGTLPRKIDDLKPYITSTNIFVCPQARDMSRYSYAFVGVTNKWEEDPNLVILREIEPNHHGKRTVLFDDGHVEVRPDTP